MCERTKQTLDMAVGDIKFICKAIEVGYSMLNQHPWLWLNYI